MRYKVIAVLLLLVCSTQVWAQNHTAAQGFDDNWKFFLGDDSLAKLPLYNDAGWRKLDLPHDWSIEGNFSDKNPATPAEGALPTGIGWYRKAFTLPLAAKAQNTFIDFDGVYRNSEVWINGHYLGKRPNGYISFRYNLTPFLHYGQVKNTITVRVDNSAQPNSRWYSGSGIYRNVWLVNTGKSYLKYNETFITTPTIDKSYAAIHIATQIVSPHTDLLLKTTIYNAQGMVVAKTETKAIADTAQQTIKLDRPILWSVTRPYLYRVEVKLYQHDQLFDTYRTNLGIRSFNFDVAKGFSLNGKPMKVLGVCMHHDLGALGAVVNTRAIERQLQILKDMGCNAIRTAHNPPAPELLDLCDKMGFLVLDEAFDMWVKKKNKFDYHSDWTQWHQLDLEDQVKRDRNHPSVFMWSIGNEIREQFDSSGIKIARELVGIVKRYDSTRPVTSALSENDPKKNFLYQSGALDVVGLNYHQEAYAAFPQNYPGQKFIATETMSAIATRGHYDMPSDSVRFWPHNGKDALKDGNPDLSVSAYDNVAAYWGSTHEVTWKIIKKYPYLSGLFIWTGFDYLGEPTPYPWPARSSYFGIVDLAGIPKDVYYMYQSEWTDKPVLHIFPHWNWPAGKVVDVWAYYNHADEVELFLNGQSVGIRKKTGDDLHVMWRLKYQPGTLKAVSRLNGKTVLTQIIKTTGPATQLKMIADRPTIKADCKDLSFITVKILDAQGNPVPDAQNAVKFKISGPGIICGIDNGLQTSIQNFKLLQHNAFNGCCVAIVKSTKKEGIIKVSAIADGLKPVSLTINSDR